MESFEFDMLYSARTGEYVGGYVPTVEHDDVRDIAIESADWSAITGKTHQHGYRGAVMHPSESADDETVLKWARDAGAEVFAIVVVEDTHYLTDDGDDDDCHAYGCDHDPVGWAVIYQ